MSNDSVPVYSATPEGGIEHKPIIEPVISKKVRINDPSYGLHTAAKIARDKVAKDEWNRQRNEAIAREHARQAEKKAARLAELNAEITRLRAALLSGTASNPDKTVELLDKLTAKCERLASK
jgi:hypothetical protein